MNTVPADVAVDLMSKSTSLPPTSADCAGVQLALPVVAVVQLSTAASPLADVEARNVTTAAVPDVLYVLMVATVQLGGISV